MPAFLIVDIDINDLPAYAEYAKQVPALVRKHGGGYLARGGEFEVIEGDWTPKRLVLFRFPDRKAIRAFFDDPEYQPLKAMRQKVAKGNLVAFDGL